MRTWSLAAATLLFAATMTAAAEPERDVVGEAESQVREAAGSLGVDVDDLLGGHEDAPDDAGDVGGASPAPAGALAAVNLEPVGRLGQGIIDLGLQLLVGFFDGVAGGVSSVKAAMATTAAAPVESAAIAAATLALAGLLSLLGAAFQRYGSLGALPLFTRIAKAELLDNKVRADIMDLVKTNPGINVSEISRRLDVAWGTATHHLQKLRAERLVNVRLVGHQKCFFPNGGTYTPREMEILSVTKSPTARKIAEFVAERGPTSHRDVSQALNLSPALVSFHARKLVDAGLLARQRQGRRTLFVPLETNLHPTPRPSVHSL
jgi:predicted transcriptional regulator